MLAGDIFSGVIKHFGKVQSLNDWAGEGKPTLAQSVGHGVTPGPHRTRAYPPLAAVNASLLAHQI